MTSSEQSVHASVAPFPPGSRLVHVGPPKTGTTAVQSALNAVRDDLARLGVHYAGPGSRPREAGKALMTGKVGTGESAAWDALVEEVAAAGDLRVCISNEQFASVDDEAAARALRDLGGDAARPVAVVRRLDKLLPSQWQQRVRRSRSMISYEDWLGIVLGDEPDGAHWDHFWRMHDLEGLVTRWRNPAAEAPMTLVVADESDREFLLRVFEGLLGLPEGVLELIADKSNRSLSLNESEFIRHLDRVADELAWPRELHQELVKPAISHSIRRSPKDDDDAPITLPGWAVARVAELNQRRIDFLRTTDARVVGDVDGLALSGEAPAGQAATDVRVTPHLAGVAVGAAVTAVLERQQQLEKRVETLTGKLERERKRADRPVAAPAAPAAGGVESVPSKELVRVVGRRVAARLRRRS